MDYKDCQRGATKDHFWFRAKNVLIDVLLNKFNGQKKRLRILNVGAGTGDDLSVIRLFGDVHVIDIDLNALELIPEELTVEKKACDACHIMYPDNYFDAVVAFDVIEHIEDDALAVGEIYRVLKPQGFFTFTVPAYEFLYSSHDRALNHLRRYDSKSIERLLSSYRCVESGFWGCSIFLPILIDRKIRGKQFNAEDQFKLSGFMNALFFNLMSMENWLIKRRIPLPAGTTIYGIYQK